MSRTAKSVLRLTVMLWCVAGVLSAYSDRAAAQWLPPAAPPVIVPSVPPSFAVPSMPLPATDVVTQYQPSENTEGGLVLTVGCELIAPVVAETRVTTDDVATRILDADVRGVQTTTTHICLQPVPCSDVARLDLVASGVVESNTVSYTPQARVASVGHHTFNIRKPVFLDGRLFLTKPAYGTVRAHQSPQAVDTVVSRMPLLGIIGNRIAWSEVYRRMPASDAIVVRRVADDVLPAVNQGVDALLADINRRWLVLRRKIHQTFAGDSLSLRCSSTSDSVTVTARNPAVQLPPERPFDAALQPPEVLVLLLADTAVNRWFSLQPLAGLVVADADLQQIALAFQQSAESPATLVNAIRSAHLAGREPLAFSLQLADDRPLGVEFDGGELAVIFRFRILPKIGVAGSLQEMRIRLRGEGAGDGMWSISLVDIEVQPADPGSVPDAWTTLIQNQTRQLAETLPPTQLQRRFELKKLHEKLPAAELYRIQTEKGWLRLSLRLSEASQRPSGVEPPPLEARRQHLAPRADGGFPDDSVVGLP